MTELTASTKFESTLAAIKPESDCRLTFDDESVIVEVDINKDVILLAEDFGFTQVQLLDEGDEDDDQEVFFFEQDN